MEIYIFWAFMGLVCAVIANLKNRNVFGWFCLGVLFSVFAAIVLMLLPSLPDEN